MNTNRLPSLNRENRCYATPEAAAFAKAYIKAHKSAYRSPYAETAADLAASDRFHARYWLLQTVRSGFAGSGEWLYGDRQTGDSYRLTSRPNGSGFYGTDHTFTVA